MDFMVDTGTEHSEVTQKIVPLSGKETTIIVGTGTQTHRHSDWQAILQSLTMLTGGQLGRTRIPLSAPFTLFA